MRGPHPSHKSSWGIGGRVPLEPQNSNGELSSTMEGAEILYPKKTSMELGIIIACLED